MKAMHNRPRCGMPEKEPRPAAAPTRGHSRGAAWPRGGRGARGASPGCRRRRGSGPEWPRRLAPGSFRADRAERPGEAHCRQVFHVSGALARDSGQPLPAVPFPRGGAGECRARTGGGGHRLGHQSGHCPAMRPSTHPNAGRTAPRPPPRCGSAVRTPLARTCVLATPPAPSSVPLLPPRANAPRPSSRMAACDTTAPATRACDPTPNSSLHGRVFVSRGAVLEAPGLDEDCELWLWRRPPHGRTMRFVPGVLARRRAPAASQTIALQAAGLRCGVGRMRRTRTAVACAPLIRPLSSSPSPPAADGGGWLRPQHRRTRRRPA